MRLSSICSIHTGYTARGQLVSAAAGGIPVIQLRDLATGRVEPSKLMHVQLGDVQDRHVARSGDVLFRSRGDRNTTVVLGEGLAEPALVVLPLMILRPKPDIVSAEYLAWVINHPKTQRFFDSVARGTKLHMVSRASLEHLELDIPDLESQRKIVAIAALADREQALSVQAAGLRKELTSKILGERAKRPRRAAATERTTN